ncbi:MAG: hypothetical protein ACD_51C00340G0003 [uncultured bacterium]|nr:MAG: hypothetical protein ACD_51C00340G0003 [uncultured bacterium]OGJ47597.1 MAG: hypothetical protein A2244_00845 [Candidatus Peregrinibacteria bacterium RIFOXYA2_FULL_41_18]OGJ49602.1 MAG: hypothetical protein A2344_02265 [Candidatus Peregrinibacteria bacterium RIFOXYB12_FULL_41_12]OGJ54368.1 MAG: hypothetical protein A2336_01015 [Candidatus Peregrinibacteria bacterium RIFOXYB2_FULL_41_88]
MKKILLAIITLTTTMTIAQSALAAYGIPDEYKPSNIAESWSAQQDGYTDEQKYNTTSITYILADLVSGLLAIVGVVAVYFLVSNGLSYATSMGQQDKIDKAKKGITWSIIGLGAILISYILVRFVIKTLFTIDESELAEETALVVSRLVS